MMILCMHSHSVLLNTVWYCSWVSHFKTKNVGKLTFFLHLCLLADTEHFVSITFYLLNFKEVSQFYESYMELCKAAFGAKWSFWWKKILMGATAARRSHRRPSVGWQRGSLGKLVMLLLAVFILFWGTHSEIHHKPN